MYRAVFCRVLLIGVLVVTVVCCAEQKKIRMLMNDSVKAEVAVAGEKDKDFRLAEIENRGEIAEPEKNISVKDLRGNRIIMNVVKDEQSGEMVATDILNEIVVEATFRNVAERNGEVDIAFEIVVPMQMQDPSWQIRFRPKFFILDDTLNLDEVHITGVKYRAAQLKGYELYNKFLSTIIPDSSNFIHSFCYKNLLQIFIDRTFRQLSRLRTDSTIVDTIVAKKLMGITEKEAIEYYTKNWLVSRNNRRKLNKEKMYGKYVKSPFIIGGVRLDSVITWADGTIRYHYVQTIKTVKGLRKVDMVMGGGIYANGKQLYIMPHTSPLTFYISSISAFSDTSVRYVKSIIERNVNVNTAAYIDFNLGGYKVNDTLSNNYKEIRRIKKNIKDVLLIKDYIIDSLAITASCSPEGKFVSNVQLARNRAYSIKKYFADYITAYTDSIRNSVWEINLSGKGEISSLSPDGDIMGIKDIDIRTKWIPEEWNRLENLIKTDSNIRDLAFLQRCFIIEDLDSREKAMRGCSDYKYIRSILYPYLRTVKFDFFLHRKGMVKDTVHTTEIDTVYMGGLRALQERDYKVAIEKLRPYNDYNAAVVYICLDYNQSALSILECLHKSAKRDYMLAVVYSRLGDERKAVEMYIHSCNQDSSMRFRGNLDPEISALIKKYGINNQEF